MHVLLLLALAAAAPPEPDDAHDLIVLHPKRPYRLRLHLRDDGRSFLVGWTLQVGRLFRHLDQNGDGRLSAAELALAPGRDQWLSITSGDRQIDPEAAPSLKEVAAGRSFATAAELQGYYAVTTAGPLQLHWRQQPPGADMTGSSLYRRLVPGGHPLTAARLKEAAGLLSKLDADDDETISEGEVMGDPTYYLAPPAARKGNAHGLALQGLPFFSSRPGRADVGLMEALKAKYRRVDPAWLRPTPDVVLRADVGSPRPPVVVASVKGVAAQPTRGGVRLAVEDWLIHVGLDAYPGAAERRDDALARFKRLDKDTNGYLDKKEIYSPPFEYVAWLRLADRDGNGEITEAEFLGLEALMAALKGKLTVLRVQDAGPSLYRLLDADGDGRLSLRELVEGHRSLGPGLAKGYPEHRLPQLYRVSVGRDHVRVRTEDQGVRPVRAFLPVRGPLWFRKMDGNGDGDVSRREWLGTREQFDAIDADGDGLIGVQEAEAYDRAARR